MQPVGNEEVEPFVTTPTDIADDSQLHGIQLVKQTEATLRLPHMENGTLSLTMPFLLEDTRLILDIFCIVFCPECCRGCEELGEQFRETVWCLASGDNLPVK